MIRYASVLCLFGILFMGLIGCGSRSRGSSVPQLTTSLIYPAGIDPARTSDDPSYGYTAQNPVKVGLPAGSDGDAAAHAYFSHLRDGDFLPMRFRKIQAGQADSEWAAIDVYELVGDDATRYRVYIEPQHPQASPLDAAAPMGMYVHK